MKRRRKNSEAPWAIAALGWRFHHVGIPTSVPHPDERYVKHLGIFKRGFETSPFGIEWMRFTPVCQAHELVRQVPHVAFEVDDLEAAIRGRELLGDITSPSDGVRVAMIVHDGAPIELLEFSAGKNRRREQGRPNAGEVPPLGPRRRAGRYRTMVLRGLAGLRGGLPHSFSA